MEIKPFHVVVATLLAVALAIGIFAGRPPQAAGVTQPTPDRTKAVNVYAQGSVAVTPTGVDLVVELWGTGKNGTEAQAALQKADKAMREALTKAGLTEGQFQMDIRFTSVAAGGAPSVSGLPEPSQSRLFERIVIGGLDSKLALKAIDVAGSLGAWAVPVRYVLRDEDKVIQWATEKAMRTARGQAETTAQAGGFKIRGVRSVAIEPPGAFFGPQPLDGASLSEQGTWQGSATGGTVSSSVGGSGALSPDAYPIAWRTALPPLNPDGTIMVTVRIRADFDF
ncbi:MAG TPA: SIMPL domain-containing protein [Bacillota bacterium]